MGAVVLVCRHCTTLLTRSLEPMSIEAWQTEQWRIWTNASPLIDEGRVLQWTAELWNEDNQYLPFVSGSWVLDPESMAVHGGVTSTFGCCGLPPLDYGPGQARRNQACMCGELVGWHNTDCLAPHFVALADDAVEALPP